MSTAKILSWLDRGIYGATLHVARGVNYVKKVLLYESKRNEFRIVMLSSVGKHKISVSILIFFVPTALCAGAHWIYDWRKKKNYALRHNKYHDSFGAITNLICDWLLFRWMPAL